MSGNRFTGRFANVHDLQQMWSIYHGYATAWIPARRSNWMRPWENATAALEGNNPMDEEHERAARREELLIKIWHWISPALAATTAALISSVIMIKLGW